MKKEKSIDDIFKHSLQDPVNEPAFRESDWDNFENMLDQGKRRGKVFWLPVLGSVAAVLLAFVSLARTFRASLRSVPLGELM